MSADELLRAIIEYGADEAGIRDRFGQNAELYELCFKDFLDEANVPALREAMQRKDYSQAFEAAHAIKGLSGNLGLSDYYNAISALVASLRANRYAQIDEEYAEVEKQFDMLRRVASGEKLTPHRAEVVQPSAQTSLLHALQKNGESKKKEWFVPFAAGIGLLTVLMVFFLFRNIVANYERNVTTESAGHLVEINHQLKKYIEDQVESDWLIAHTVKSYLIRSTQAGNSADMLSVMRELRNLWRVSDIILYTDNGFCISVDGKTGANDHASDTITEAFMRGEYMKIVESDITYTVSVDTSLEYNGSKIAAVSVVKGMESFMDEMGLSSFDESAYVYLCNGKGAVISKLNTGDAIVTFNVLSLLREGALTTTDHRPVSVGDVMEADAPTTYIYNDQYCVITPIETRNETFWLAYFVPENIVNKTMSSFSGRVTKSSVAVIAVFTALAILTVVYLNSLRKKQLDKALLTREHMFDLLVKSSQTGFALLEINQPRPSFVSSNSYAIVGDASPGLYKTENGFELRSETNPKLRSFSQINETLRDWDGASVFRSGFIQNTESPSPSYFEIQLMPAGNDSDEYIGVAQDVTLLNERETFIRNALSMAEQASDAKSRFLSNMSHDIRTPMNAIVNMADFAMEDMANPEKLSEDLKIIRESSDHLLGLINDILDMSRIESGKTTVDGAPFDLMAELKRMQSIISSLCAEKKQTLITDFDGLHTSLVLGDQIKVSQILMNLLSNAVKFTPSNGAVRFSAKETPSIRENYIDVRFVVEDNGIGISPAFLPYIFDSFAREDAKRVSGIQGTGLGLAICHSYVAAMGGQIKCESVEGDGTTFTVDLFFEKAEDAEPAPPETTAWDVKPFIGMRCLLCEDNLTNQRIGKTILERLGFLVDVAGDGAEGLTAFKKSPPGYYDVIYMDIQMPNMDGYEAAVAIRESNHAQARTVPMIALSANVFIEDVEKAHIAGMDGHVGKPVTTAALANETKTVLNKHRRRPT